MVNAFSLPLSLAPFFPLFFFPIPILQHEKETGGVVRPSGWQVTVGGDSRACGLCGGGWEEGACSE